MVTDQEIENEVALMCRDMVGNLRAEGHSLKDANHSVYIVHQSMIRSHIRVALLLKEHRAKKAQSDKKE